MGSRQTVTITFSGLQVTMVRDALRAWLDRVSRWPAASDAENILAGVEGFVIVRLTPGQADAVRICLDRHSAGVEYDWPRYDAKQGVLRQVADQLAQVGRRPPAGADSRDMDTCGHCSADLYWWARQRTWVDVFGRQRCSATGPRHIGNRW